MAFVQTAMLFVVQLFCAMDRDDEGDSITSITTVTAKSVKEPAAAH